MKQTRLISDITEQKPLMLVIALVRIAGHLAMPASFPSFPIHTCWPGSNAQSKRTHDYDGSTVLLVTAALRMDPGSLSKCAERPHASFPQATSFGMPTIHRHNTLCPPPLSVINSPPVSPRMTTTFSISRSTTTNYHNLPQRFKYSMNPRTITTTHEPKPGKSI